MNREEKRNSLKGKKNYFKCPECNFKHRVVIEDNSIKDNTRSICYIMCDCGISAFITIENGYVISVDKVWK